MQNDESVWMPVDWRVSWPELMEIDGAGVSGELQEVFPPNVMTAREVLFRQAEQEREIGAAFALMAMPCKGSKKGGKKSGGKKGK